MAEYYPLLSRAIARLGASTPEARKDVYERARKALLTQLRSIDPPASEEDIGRENSALDDASSRIEAEILADTAVVSDVAAAANPTLPAKEPSRPNVETRAPAVPAPRPQAARDKPVDKAPADKPPADKPLANKPPVAVAPPVALSPAASPASGGPRAPILRVEMNHAVPGDDNAPLLQVGRRGNGEAPALSDLGAPLSGPTVPQTSWLSGFARARKPAPTANAVLPAEGAAADEAVERIEPIRPIAPEFKPARTSFIRIWLFGFVLIALVGGVALLAFKLRDNPGDFGRRQASVIEPEVATPGGKIVERVGAGAIRATPDSNAPPPPVQTVQARPTASAMPEPATTSPPAAQPIMAVSQVAALVVDAPDEPQKIKAYVGTAIWRNEPGFDGLPVVTATLDIPEAGLSAVMRITKNMDAKLTAANLIDLRFTATRDSIAPGIKDIGTPQMRNEDRPSGDPLAGAPAKITDNYFLVGLNGGEALSRNIDLVRSRGWFDIPILLSNDKIAKITFQKGATGDRILNDAFSAWASDAPR